MTDVQKVYIQLRLKQMMAGYCKMVEEIATNTCDIEATDFEHVDGFIDALLLDKTLSIYFKDQLIPIRSKMFELENLIWHLKRTDRISNSKRIEIEAQVERLFEKENK